VAPSSEISFALWTPAQAFDAYEAVRGRLPGAAFPRASEAALSIERIAERYDAFLLDAFGVLNVGETAIPGAAARVAALQAAGKRVLVLTNSASRSPEVGLAKYRSLGFDFALEDVVSSRDALKRGLTERTEAVWACMAPPTAEVGELGVAARLLEDDPQPYRDADAIILLGSAGWTPARQEMLETALRARPRPVLVGNPDIVAPREAGLTPEPGHFAHALADRLGLSPHFYGKPFRNIFELAFERLGDVPRERVLMVGDSLHTDVLGGAAAGVHTALVTSFGLFRTCDVQDLIRRSGIVPYHVVASL
jgi:HAD superfamily hydrolase (TIGR01459 family)